MFLRYEISFFPKSAGYKNFIVSKTEERLYFGKNYPLPISKITREYSEFTEVKLTRTPEQARELGERMLNARVINEFSAEADIIDKKLVFSEHDGYVELEALITTIEPIGRPQAADGGLNADPDTVRPVN
jgi:hypothetical protein